MEKAKNLSKRVKIRIAVIVILVIIIAVLGMVIYKIRFSSNNETGSFPDIGSMNFDGMTTSEFVGAYGVTSIGTTPEEFPVDSLTTGLEVEEVLITAGEMVNMQTPVLKFTDESIEAAREELESALRAADLAYRAGKIEYEQAKISAEYEYETTVLAGQHAEAVYSETIVNMEDSVEKAREAYEEAKAEIAEYENALANDTYKANVDECQEEYDENYDLLVQYMEEWGIEWSEVTGMGGAQGDATRIQYVNILRDLYGVLEANQKDLKAAEEEYDDAVGNANFNLQTLQLSLPELEKAYANAQASYEISLIQAKLTKETSLTEAELAQKNYETSLEKAEADFEALEDAKADAENNLAIFEAQMGTGYYYPGESGIVLRMSIREGRDITSGSTIFTIRNSEEMTVTVSVDQDDIAKLKVGDIAMIQSEESGMYEGVISAINPVSNSESRSSFTYSVTVEVTGNAENLSANETVSVYFTVGGSDDKET